MKKSYLVAAALGVVLFLGSASSVLAVVAGEAVIEGAPAGKPGHASTTQETYNYTIAVAKIQAAKDKATADAANKLANEAAEVVKFACIKTAVGVREAAITAGIAPFSAAVTAAYTKRAADLNAAYGVVDKVARRAAIRKSWVDFNAGVAAARSAWHKTRDDAWTAFAAARVACKANTSEVGSEMGSDRIFSGR